MSFWLKGYWVEKGLVPPSSSSATVLWPMSRIVRDYLIEKGVVTLHSSTVDWSCSVAAAPKEPVNCVVVYDEAALKRGRTFLGGVREDPVVTIVVRGTKPEETHYKARLILKAMDELFQWSWVADSGERGQVIEVQNARRSRGILPLGVDDNGRWLFNLEYALVIQSIEE